MRLVALIAGVMVASAATIYSDNLYTGTFGSTVTSNNNPGGPARTYTRTILQSGVTASGSFPAPGSLRLENYKVESASINIAGYTNLVLAFKVQSYLFEIPDNGVGGTQKPCSYSYKIGSGAWVTDILLTGTLAAQQNVVVTWNDDTIPDGSTMQIRFSGSPSSADYCYFWELVLTGDLTSAPTVAPTAAPPTPSPTRSPTATPTPPTTNAPTPLLGYGLCAACLPAGTDFADFTCTGACAYTRAAAQFPASYLQGSTVYSTANFISDMSVPPAGQAKAPSNSFEGVLTFPAAGDGTAQMKIDGQVDTFSYLVSPPDRSLWKLPTFTLNLVQDGSRIIPSFRGPSASTHYQWEPSVEPGYCWDEAGDTSGYTRCAIPFALAQKNANCAHNGIFTFLFRSNNAGGAADAVSKVAYQIVQETCDYFQADMWGLVTATFTHTAVANAATIRSNYVAEVAGRMQVKDISALTTDYPTTDYTIFGSEINAGTNKLMSQYGVVYKDPSNVDTVYSGGFETRFGNWPALFEDGFIVPSYSTAKTLWTTLAAARLAQKYGVDPTTATVASVFTGNSQAQVAPWTTTTIGNLINMQSGRYASTGYMTDEDSTQVQNNFFLATTAASKLSFSLTYGSSSLPSRPWVYHTHDTHLALMALQNWYRTQSGNSAALILDLMKNEVWGPIGMSATALNPRVTYETSATPAPFGGWGMWLLRDDIAKISNFVNKYNGKVGATQIVSASMLNTALSRSCPGSCGIQTSKAVASDPTRYFSNNVWKKQYLLPSSTTPQCGGKWASFLSGYGGISVVFLEGGANYFYWSDSDTFQWGNSAWEAGQLDGTCPAAANEPGAGGDDALTGGSSSDEKMIGDVSAKVFAALLVLSIFVFLFLVVIVVMCARSSRTQAKPTAASAQAPVSGVELHA